MRKVTKIRLGIATAVAVVGAVGAIAGGCTSDDSNIVPPPGTDAGPTGTDGATGPTTDGATGPGTDSGPPGDSGPPVDSAPPPYANLIIAHTAPGVPPFRVCFATQTNGVNSVASFSALPEAPGLAPPVPAMGPFPATAAGTPGIYPGTIGAFPSILDLTHITLAPFAILAASIANDVNTTTDGGVGTNTADGGKEESCAQLIGSHGAGTADTPSPGRLTAGQDFFPLPVIAAGTLADYKAYLLTVTGCLPGTATSNPTGTCGANYDGGVNVDLGITEIDTSNPAADSGAIGVQFAHRSSALEGTPYAVGDVTVHDPASFGVWPTFIAPVVYDAGDDAAPVVVPTPFGVGDAAAGPVTFASTGLDPAASTAVSLPLIDPTATYFGVFTQPLDGGTPSPAQYPQGDLIALPLGLIEQLSGWTGSTDPAGTPQAFAAGNSYIFVLTGDPAQALLFAANPDGGTTPVLNPQYDGRGLHILGFPSNFAPTHLAP